MDRIDPYKMMLQLSEAACAGQMRKPEDYEDEHGLLVCGTCHQHRQEIMYMADPRADDPEHQSPLVVTKLCRCEREAIERAKTARAAVEDMENIRKLKSASLMDAQSAFATFDNFRQTKYNGKNLDQCRRYAQKFDMMLEDNKGMIFWGDVGTGKSFAAACIANYLLDRNVPVVMTSFVKLVEDIQFGKAAESDIIRWLNRAKLVIFDDLGAERDTGYAIERVYSIIDSRCRAKLPMILTTNLTFGEMKQESDIRYKRIYDRVFENCHPIQFTGPSFRRESAYKHFDEMEKLLAED